MKIIKSEAFSFYSHLLGFFLSICGTIFLYYSTSSRFDYKAVSLIYGLSVTFLFAASSLYHANKKQENDNSFYRKLDHLAIFFMIAGSYTPVTYIYLHGAWKWSIISIQWGLVLLGLVFKIFWINAPRKLNTAIYLAMGWIAIIPIKQFITAMSFSVAVYLAMGAAAYTIGAIIYASKKPVIKPGVFGFHEIFHIFILLGGFFHYLMVFFTMV